MIRFFISFIFWIVARVLYYIGVILHLTYNEINIIAYYGLIPLSWGYMIDKLVGWQIEIGSESRFVPAFSLVWIGLWIMLVIILNWRFRSFCDWAFNKSVDFLNYFNRWGGNYILNSVVICVGIPILVYILLFVLLYLRN